MADDLKVRVRMSIDEDIATVFKADSMADKSTMSADVEQFMLDRNRQRRHEPTKAAKKKSTDSTQESTDLNYEE
jgi:ribosomal protein L14E/L6E/L27E